jgi:hypothetical protein
LLSQVRTERILSFLDADLREVGGFLLGGELARLDDDALVHGIVDGLATGAAVDAGLEIDDLFVTLDRWRRA